jgi:hypothetical protein
VLIDGRVLELSIFQSVEREDPVGIIYAMEYIPEGNADELPFQCMEPGSCRYSVIFGNSWWSRLKMVGFFPSAHVMAVGEDPVFMRATKGGYTHARI